MNIQQKIENKEYNATSPWVSRSKDRAAWDARRAEEAVLLEQFHADLADDFGLTGHPKEKTLFEIAYRTGHSGGLSEVYHHYQEWSVLLAD